MEQLKQVLSTLTSIVLTAVIVAVVIILMLIAHASAHSFYSSVCCGGRDCAPVPAEVVMETGDGVYVAPIGTTKPPVFFPWGDRHLKRIPPEADISDEDRQSYHVCTAGGSPDGTMYCVYLPDRGF